MEQYHVLNENSEYPIVVCFPHSGTYVPEEIRNRMKDSAVLTNMDWFLPELFDFLTEMKITQIISTVSRYVVDLNREPHNYNQENYKQSVVYETNTFGNPLYDKAIKMDEITQRIERYYRPYHEKLRNLLEYKISKFGKVYLLDIHSFFKQYDEDVCIGNSDGATSSIDTIRTLENNLLDHTFSTKTDSIFKGGNTIKYYRKLFGKAFEGLILEINYRTYIENRHFGEEEVSSWNEALFNTAKIRFEKAFKETFGSWCAMEGTLKASRNMIF